MDLKIQNHKKIIHSVLCEIVVSFVLYTYFLFYLERRQRSCNITISAFSTKFGAPARLSLHIVYH